TSTVTPNQTLPRVTDAIVLETTDRRRQRGPRSLLPRFPRRVSETVTRITAGQVVVLNVLALLTRQWWLLAVVAADYVIRAVAGPRFSPLARLGMVARQWLRLPENPTAGPPKRFAATVGAGMMVLAAVLGLAGQATAAYVAGGIMVLLPALESFTGFCAGCAIFGQLMRWNLIPEEVCEA